MRINIAAVSEQRINLKPHFSFQSMEVKTMMMTKMRMKMRMIILRDVQGTLQMTTTPMSLNVKVNFCHDNSV